MTFLEQFRAVFKLSGPSYDTLVTFSKELSSQKVSSMFRYIENKVQKTSYSCQLVYVRK